MTSLATHKMNIEAYLISEGQFPYSDSQLNLPYSSLGTLTYQNTPESTALSYLRLTHQK